ncbi:MAG: DUF2949 domain-containing protein [Chloroflexaceae bacterium]|nr:DUF2949 domain-containing protein [Chloroflexaceae bacterium]
MQSQLIEFLQKELSLSNETIAVALRRCQAVAGELPMVLWQYGFITSEQLERIFEWQDSIF